MSHPETNLQSKDLRSTVANLHFHTSRLSSVVSVAPCLGTTPPAEDLHSPICTLTRTQNPLSPPGTVMVLGHDRSSPGSPFSDLHSLHYQVTSHTKSSKSPTNSHAPWARLFQLRISILRSALTLHAPHTLLGHDPCSPCFQPWARRSHSSICSLRSAVCAVSECRDGTGTEAADACTQVTSLQRIRQAQHFIGAVC